MPRAATQVLWWKSLGRAQPHGASRRRLLLPEGCVRKVWVCLQESHLSSVPRGKQCVCLRDGDFAQRWRWGRLGPVWGARLCWAEVLCHSKNGSAELCGRASPAAKLWEPPQLLKPLSFSPWNFSLTESTAKEVSVQGQTPALLQKN